VYILSTPVTIYAKESSLIPISEFLIKSDPVLYYDPKVNEVNAIKACHLINDTDLVLANGSVSVLENGRFVGQCAFTPMLPGDDQLIPYGLDSTVSIIKTLPQDLQLTTVETLVLSFRNQDGVQFPNGIITTYKHQKQTSYTIKNNSDRVIQKFYVDHTADTNHNGYVITTIPPNCIKSVIGFSRYQFTLNPFEEVNFVVCEEAFYTVEQSSQGDLITSVKTKLPQLLKLGVITQVVIDTIIQIVVQRDTLQALQQIESESFSEKNLLTWKSGSSLATPKVKDGIVFVEPLVNQALLDKVESILTLENKKRETRRIITQFNEHIKKIVDNQGRLRDNIKSLDKMPNSDLIKRYLKDLGTQEDDLFETRGKIEQLEAEEAKLDNDLKKMKFEVIDGAKKEKESMMIARGEIVKKN